MTGRKRTKEQTNRVFGEEMIPCPKCGSWNLGYQSPIKTQIEATDSAEDVLKKYFSETKSGKTPLQGPVFIWCWECFHKGPALDCTGRTSEEVNSDREVARKVRSLWNEQQEKK